MNSNAPLSINGKYGNLKSSYLLPVTLILLTCLHGGEVVWQFLLLSSLILALLIHLSTSNFHLLKSVFLENKSLIILLCAWIIYQVLTLIPLPINAVDWLSPTRLIEPINTNKESNALSLTISHYETTIAIARNTIYLVALIVALTFTQNKTGILLFTKFIFLASSAIAVYSLVNHYTNGAIDLISSIPPWTITWDKAAHGTFSYQNHYAAYLNLTLPLGLGLIYYEQKKAPTYRTTKYKLANVLNFTFSKRGFYLFCCIVMYFALLKTSSRGGNAIFILGGLLTWFIATMLSRVDTIKQKLLKFSYSLLILLLLGFAVLFAGAADSLTQRLENHGFTPNGRDLMQDTAVAIIKDYPLVGTGAGTYPIIQHSYKTPKLGHSEMSKHAHNDYLELLSTQGVIGLTFLSIPILIIIFTLIKALFTRKHRSLYGIQVACFCSTITILMHSFADFNFQLPAITMHFFVIAAIGIQCKKRYEKKGCKR